MIDKITILEIKNSRITSEKALRNVRFELNLLNEKAHQILARRSAVLSIKIQLSCINETLWDIEDKIREKERKAEFDSVFIELARSVYKTNDRRAALKKEINTLLNSRLVEEKSYSN